MRTMQSILFTERLKKILLSLGYERENIVYNMDDYREQVRKYQTNKWEKNNNILHRRGGTGYFVTTSSGLFRDSKVEMLNRPMVAVIFQDEIPSFKTTKEEKQKIIRILRFLELKIPEKTLYVLRKDCRFTDEEVKLVLDKTLPLPV